MGKRPSKEEIIKIGYENDGVIVIGAYGLYNGRKHYMVKCKKCGKKFHSEVRCIEVMKSCGCTRGGRMLKSSSSKRTYENVPHGLIDPDVLEKVRESCRKDDDEYVSIKPLSVDERLYIQFGSRADKWHMKHIPNYGQGMRQCQT